MPVAIQNTAMTIGTRERAFGDQAPRGEPRPENQRGESQHAPRDEVPGTIQITPRMSAGRATASSASAHGLDPDEAVTERAKADHEPYHPVDRGEHSSSLHWASSLHISP